MTKRVRFILLLLLSLLSVFFAEVISGSMPLPLFDFWGYVVVIPLYGLHTILLITLIYKVVQNKPISFASLYAAGILFGLYEAYITKVLWDGLTPDSIMWIELAIIDFIVLVFFWHPIMSFIVPLLVFEAIMTSSNAMFQGLPQSIQRLLSTKWGIILLMVIVGLFSAFNGVIPENLFVSILGMGIPILLVILYLKRSGHDQYALEDIIPSKQGIILGSIYLAAIYVFMTFFDQFDVLTLLNQIVIWLIYVGAITLLYFTLRQNQRLDPIEGGSIPSAMKPILGYLTVIMVSGPTFVVLFWLLGIRDLMVGITWILWVLIGLFLFIRVMIFTMTPKQEAETK